MTTESWIMHTICTHNYTCQHTDGTHYIDETHPTTITCADAQLGPLDLAVRLGCTHAANGTQRTVGWSRTTATGDFDQETAS